MTPMPLPSDQAGPRCRPGRDGDMIALLDRLRPQTDSEAFAALRRNFPASALGERVAALGSWRRR